MTSVKKIPLRLLKEFAGRVGRQADRTITRFGALSPEPLVGEHPRGGEAGTSMELDGFGLLPLQGSIEPYFTYRAR